MADTYYTLTQEARLADLVRSVRDTLAPAQWNATPFLREQAAISNESLLWQRFSEQGFLDVPVGPLMLAETMFIAHEKGWRLEGQATRDALYLSLTEQGHATLIEQHRRQAAGFEEILRRITPPGGQRWYAPYGTAHIFVPAFRLARRDERAYVSWYNESCTLPSGKVSSSLGESVVLDRTGRDTLDISHVLFYNPGLELDIRQRQDVRKFWA